MPVTRLKNLDTVILVGGLGTRLRSVISDRPKPMALFHGKPFLDYVIEFLVEFGISRVVLCVGYQAEVVKKYYQSNVFSRTVNLIFSFEPARKLLGTAGAVKNAQRYVKSDPFLVLNGDSLCKPDLNKFLVFHQQKKAEVSIVLTKSTSSPGTDVGSVAIDSNYRITRFCEKVGTKNKLYINAGIYMFSQQILSLIPSPRGKISLEYDLFPYFKNIYGYVTKSPVWDIGTPERYRQINQQLM